jgi:serine/threonine protein kinase
VTFFAVYAYGHLLGIAFSLAVALACAAVALRIPAARKDLGLSLVYLLIAATGAVEMTLALRPSLWIGRAYLMYGGTVFLGLVVTFHHHYANEVLPAPRRRIYWSAIAGLTAYGLVLLVLILTGVLDGGRTRVVELWGARSMLPAMSVWACVPLALFAVANVPLCAEIYFSGPNRMSRWRVSSGIWAGPLVAAWDLSICAGLNPYLPIGGWLAAVVAVEGAVQLVERLRDLPRVESSLAGYRLERQIGSGGMAEVFLASRRPGNGLGGVVQKVALKRMREDLASDPHFVRMFLDEARILARLSHPNIVQLLDAGSDSGKLYLAMELVDGATLQQIFRVASLRNERLSPAAVVEVGMQLCGALETAHTLTGDDGRPLELVHRDISPQNVLVDRRGTVKLSDFGIARSADRLTETATGLVKGKMSYMAPEQIRGAPFDRRADLYSLGVILFELLTGERLYRPASDAELMYQILEGRNQRMELLRSRPPRIADVVRGALAADPAERSGSAAALRFQLSSLREGEQGTTELARWVELALQQRRQSEAPTRNRMVTITSVGPTVPNRRT